MDAIARAYAELQLPTMPEIMEGTPIHADDVGMVYVLNPTKSAGEMIWPSQLYAMPIEEIGGWYEITQKDVNQKSLATADD